MDAFRDSLLQEVSGIVASDFEHIITRTTNVPSIDDESITYPNLLEHTQKSKLLESAVLFVDLRNSTSISLMNEQGTLSALYSVYIRAMSRCAHYFNGHVRNIIGDRLMVVFDRKNCFENTSNTAMLMNSVAHYLLDREIDSLPVQVGIGLDFGEMLITKTGIIKQGTENIANKSLVWLGKPANVASKLTDIANKPRNPPERRVEEGHYYDALEEWGWYEKSVDSFLDNLNAVGGRITHKSPYFETFFKTVSTPPINPPILMTEDFHSGLVREHPDLKQVKESYWTVRSVSVSGYSGKIYGGNGYYPPIQDY